MAQKINWNVVLIGGAVVAGLYLFNKTRSGVVSENYYSGTTSETIPQATQPTIRTDLRQSGKSQRTQIRQSERTTRAIGRQEVRINKADERTTRAIGRQLSSVSRLNIRQSSRTQRQAQRQQTLLKIGSGIKSAASGLLNSLKRKK